MPRPLAASTVATARTAAMVTPKVTTAITNSYATAAAASISLATSTQSATCTTAAHPAAALAIAILTLTVTTAQAAAASPRSVTEATLRPPAVAPARRCALSTTTAGAAKANL